MTDIVILAAGKGTRMRSRLPKVLHALAGRPLLQHVIDTVTPYVDTSIKVVVGHGADQVRQRISGTIEWVEQERQLGTGHAVLQALPLLGESGKTLVLFGDVPLVQPSTVERMLQLASANDLVLLTVDLADPTGYGRIVRDGEGRIRAIVEHKDASPEELEITEINTGIMILDNEDMRRWLPSVGNDNAQGEFYLPDVVAMAVGDGRKVVACQPEFEWEVQGVNSRVQLAALERDYQRHVARQLMDGGVTLADPARFDCRGTLRSGQDVFIDVNCVFNGSVELGDNVSIGAHCVITDARIADGAVIKPHSVLEDCSVGANAEVGPFARLRPGTELAAGGRIGNFVETKKARIGEGSKINHLTYIGDAEIGRNVNVGAGTITCNYDGVNKHKTVLEDGSFIGSNTSLVAPVTVGRNATVGAGSTVTQDVPGDNLAVARGKQRNVPDWKRPVRKTDKG